MTITLVDAEIGREYVVAGFAAQDEELESFLLSLGCYEGAAITVVSQVSSSYVVSIKDGRYNLSPDLAEVIEICE